ncbi:homeobox-leucine zipper protein ATHB-52-like [Andrographis paniculata]|uniref:homeobox-leucine zipper protein ATHB-52-like n=1 Tax=Andrographis paniculata TaxID=175694 RepID=UPI0021E763D7|nr:homeobox-leucine zipper protein ATHB-52-like [Andrographis paniculata]
MDENQSRNNNHNNNHQQRFLHHQLIRKNKKRLSQEQVRVLEANFSYNNKLEPDLKARLAAELGVPPRQVAIWYQNKRAREKNHGLEASHQALQQQLESVMSQNARLNGEVDRLKEELRKIQAAAQYGGGGGVNGHNLVERELYASLIAGAGGSVYVAAAAQDGYNFFGS